MVRKYLFGTVVDLACGDNELLSKYNCGPGYGVDIVDYGNADILVKDFAQLPIESESIDCIAIVASLNYFDDVPTVLAECKRVLRPDGRIIITMMNYAVGRIWHSFREPWARRAAIKTGEIVENMNQLGFRLVKTNRFMLGLNCLYIFGLEK